MCSYHTLSFDEKHGYIVYCTQCKYLQFAFGCVLINFQREEFAGFRRVVNEIIEDYPGEPDNWTKRITIPTPCTELLLFLSLGEIRVLHRIIEEADSNLTANDLMRLFHD